MAPHARRRDQQRPLGTALRASWRCGSADRSVGHVSRSRKGDLKISKNDAGPPLSPLPQAPRGLAPGWRAVLPLVVLIYVCVASIHAFKAPVGATGYQDAPDEEAHV